MKLIDKNETLIPPENYSLDTTYAVGAYLQLNYSKLKDNGFVSHTTIFLNDQGREVIRCAYFTPPEVPDTRPIKLKSWWARLTRGFKQGE